ncbi:putative aminopeptidase [Smittium mucronatum]|uniref:Putative aminopeptidase n=1 Tax=Smittium mucronatum TaxID=133383 RepID=A0A1R0H3C6_9FUNG|nr:putative aminopeptidase [Smittium mucronatum]
MLPNIQIIHSEFVTQDFSSDSAVVIYTSKQDLESEFLPFSGLASSISSLEAVDSSAHKETVFLVSPHVPGARLILSPISTLETDTADVRLVADAVKSGLRRAIKAGSRSPSIYLSNITHFPESADSDYSNWIEVAILASLEESYVSLVAREWNSKKEAFDKNEKFDSLKFVISPKIICDTDILLRNVSAIESGKRLARDLGYCDAERMTPYKMAAHIQNELSSIPGLTVVVDKDLESIRTNYPLTYHSARASFSAEHTRPAIVEITYKSPEQSSVSENLYLVGKGVTFDTGGINIKVGAAMNGMSRDKLGACSVAGFLLTTGLLQPTHVNVTGFLSLTRNSVGPNSLLPDEVLVSRAGVRVHIINTDAEGRLVMTDPLAVCRERIDALRQSGDTTDSTVYTVATLTGHAVRAYGPYGATVANGPARLNNKDRKISAFGTRFGDPFENSILRREDYSLIASHSDREDVFQVTHQSSANTSRGHQFPAAYMIIASGLDKHGLGSSPSNRIDYIHLDIAGNAEESSAEGLGLPKITANPITTLTYTHLL